MTTKARKLARKTRAAELDMEIMRAREANGLPVISPMLGLPREKWECEFRDYLVALGDPRVADPEWLAARIREEQRRARWFVKWFDAWFEESANGFDFGKEEAENHIKAWKNHLAADRTSCHQAEANQFRLRQRSSSGVACHRCGSRSWSAPKRPTCRLARSTRDEEGGGAAGISRNKPMHPNYLPSSARLARDIRITAASARLSAMASAE